MNNPQIRFNNGATYEQYMGKWSQLAGQVFLDWLAPAPDLRWLDVGCGNGAFTEMLIEQCSPLSVHGIDPSEAQLAYAQARPALHAARLSCGDAMALPYPGNLFDVAVMPLVIFFVPDPFKGVMEMVRTVSPDGVVAAYAWDMEHGGFPYHALHTEMRELGVSIPTPPSPDASSIEVMRDLWTAAGLHDIDTRKITVQRTFASFDEYWTIALGAPSIGQKLATMSPSDIATLKTRMRACLPTDTSGRIMCNACANAVKGHVPVPR